MSRIRVPAGGAAFALALALGPPPAARAAEPPSAPRAQERRAVPVPKDLFAVITLRGKPCGAVKSYERRGDADYLVECTDGHRYRVYVTDEERVVVEER